MMIRDWWTWVRGGGPAPLHDDADMWANTLGCGCAALFAIVVGVVAWFVF